MKKIIDMTNLAECCLKKNDKTETYIPIPTTPDSIIHDKPMRDQETQTDNIQESSKT